MGMLPEQKLALARLKKWSDPQAPGDPTARMVQIWKTPAQMRYDVGVVLAMIKES